MLKKLHGATYTVDVEFRTPTLVDGSNWVLDIGQALEILQKVVKQYNYKNLDKVEKLKGQNTTTEFMCRQVWLDIVEELKGGWNGVIRVKMDESHKAWASYEGKVAMASKT